MAFVPRQEDNVELICYRTNKSSNICYYNFKVDGGKYRFEDVGCRYSRKREEIIEKVKEGKLALSKDWKMECPQGKKDNTGQ